VTVVPAIPIYPVCVPGIPVVSRSAPIPTGDIDMVLQNVSRSRTARPTSPSPAPRQRPTRGPADPSTTRSASATVLYDTTSCNVALIGLALRQRQTSRCRPPHGDTFCERWPRLGVNIAADLHLRDPAFSGAVAA